MSKLPSQTHLRDRRRTSRGRSLAALRRYRRDLWLTLSGQVDHTGAESTKPELCSVCLPRWFSRCFPRSPDFRASRMRGNPGLGNPRDHDDVGRDRHESHRDRVRDPLRTGLCAVGDAVLDCSRPDVHRLGANVDPYPASARATQGLMAYVVSQSQASIDSADKPPRTFSLSRALGYSLTGFFDDRVENRPEKAVSEAKESEAEGNASDPEPIELAGSLTELVESCRAGQVETVLITLPMRAEDRIRYLLDQLSDSTVSVYIVPDFFVFELLHSRWTSLGGLPASQRLRESVVRCGRDRQAGRPILALATAALVVASIPMACIAIGIKLTSKGPVFFPAKTLRARRQGNPGLEVSFQADLRQRGGR